MKKTMFIGKTGSGKTSLIQRLQNRELLYHKTQGLVFEDFFIDSPGEYLENKHLLNSLIITAADCEYIGLVQQADDAQSLFPPGLGMVFNKPIIGIISKIDLENTHISIVENQLRMAGALEIFQISSVTLEGIVTLQDFLHMDMGTEKH